MSPAQVEHSSPGEQTPLEEKVSGKGGKETSEIVEREGLVRRSFRLQGSASRVEDHSLYFGRNPERRDCTKSEKKSETQKRKPEWSGRKSSQSARRVANEDSERRKNQKQQLCRIEFCHGATEAGMLEAMLIAKNLETVMSNISSSQKVLVNIALVKEGEHDEEDEDEEVSSETSSKEQMDTKEITEQGVANETTPVRSSSKGSQNAGGERPQESPISRVVIPPRVSARKPTGSVERESSAEGEFRKPAIPRKIFDGQAESTLIPRRLSVRRQNLEGQKAGGETGKVEDVDVSALSLSKVSKAHTTLKPSETERRGKQQETEEDRQSEASDDTPEIQEIVRIRNMARGMPWQQQGLGFAMDTFGRDQPSLEWYQPLPQPQQQPGWISGYVPRMGVSQVGGWIPTLPQYPQSQYWEQGQFGRSLQPQQTGQYQGGLNRDSIDHLRGEQWDNYFDFLKTLNDGLKPHQKSIMGDLIGPLFSARSRQARDEIKEKMMEMREGFIAENKGTGRGDKTKSSMPPPITAEIRKQGQRKKGQLSKEDENAASRERDVERWLREKALEIDFMTGEIEISSLDVDTLISVTAYVFKHQPAYYWEKVGWCYDIAKTLMERLDRGEQVYAEDYNNLQEACHFGDDEYVGLSSSVEAYAEARDDSTRDALSAACAALFVEDINNKRREKGWKEYKPDLRSTEVLLYERPEGRNEYRRQEWRERPQYFSQALGSQFRERKEEHPKKDWQDRGLAIPQWARSEIKPSEIKGSSGKMLTGGKLKLKATDSSITSLMRRESVGLDSDSSARKRSNSTVLRSETDVPQKSVDVSKKKAKKDSEGKLCTRESDIDERREDEVREMRRMVSTIAFACQYRCIPDWGHRLHEKPLADKPVVKQGTHWTITGHVGEMVKGEEVGAKFNLRVPEELEDVDLFTPIEIAIFRRLLTLVNLKGIGRLKPDRGMAKIFTDDWKAVGRQMVKYGDAIFGDGQSSWISDKDIEKIIQMWADKVKRADEEWGREFEYPLVVEKALEKEPSMRIESATAELDDRWEHLLNRKRAEWVKEYARKTEKFTEEVIAAMMKVRYNSKETRVLFTDNENVTKGDSLWIEIIRDGEHLALNDFYLRNIMGPQFKGFIIWMSIEKWMESPMYRDHWTSIRNHVILAHKKGHWFYLVTQSEDKKSSKELHGILKEHVEELGLTQGELESSPENDGLSWHWSTNLPRSRQQGEESPEEIIKLLKRKYEESLEERGPALRRRRRSARDGGLRPAPKQRGLRRPHEPQGPYAEAKEVEEKIQGGDIADSGDKDMDKEPPGSSRSSNIKEADNKSDGSEKLPFLRLAALVGELQTIKDMKQEVFKSVEEAVRMYLGERHKVRIVGSTVHDLGVETSDLDISITGDDKKNSKYGRKLIADINKTLVDAYGFKRKKGEDDDQGSGQWVLTYVKKSEADNYFATHLFFGTPVQYKLTRILEDYGRNFLVKALCRIMNCWAYGNSLFETSEGGFNSSMIYILAIKTAIQNMEEIKRVGDPEATRRRNCGEFQTDDFDPKVKNANHEHRLVDLIGQCLAMIANTDWGKMSVEIEEKEMQPRTGYLGDDLMEIIEPINDGNLAYRVTNKDFLDVIKVVAQEAREKLARDPTPRALNLTETGETLSKEVAEKNVTADGKWIPPMKKGGK